MQLKRDVTIKVIVTEEFKKTYKEELKKAADQISASMQQLQFRVDQVVADVAKTDLERAGELRRQFDMERQRQDRTKAEIMVEMQKADRLELESEFERGTVESLVEVKVGDDFEAKITGAEIVVKDGKVVEIRD